MGINNNSREERHCTNDAAPLQTSPASRVAHSSTSTSNFLDPALAVDSILNTNHRTENAKNRMRGCSRKTTPILLATCAFISCLLVRYLTGGVTTGSSAGDNISKDHVHYHESVDFGKSMNATFPRDNDFVNQFRHAIKTDSLSLSPGHINNDGFIPFILRNGKLLCRRIHRNKIRQTTRIRAVAEMTRIGLELYKQEHLVHKVRSELPFLLLNSDSNGCFGSTIKKQRDHFNFPRFTWSYPSPKHGTGWCKAIPVPSYLSWKTFHKDHKSHSSWNLTFALQSNEYPWSSKIKRAVWRGATTYDTHFVGVELNETPRGKLVQKSMENPELIDAGFVKLIQQYESRNDKFLNQTILTERMHFDDQMKYKAILDIDGNNWSGRFPKLLCANSVVIKIDPDYIEYFYHELKPMVHYVPASIENVSQVAAYVLDNENEDEMKGIVDSANSWCKRKMTERGMAKDIMIQLEKYWAAVNDYMQGSMYNESMTPLISDVVNDLVECY